MEPINGKMNYSRGFSCLRRPSNTDPAPSRNPRQLPSEIFQHKHLLTAVFPLTLLCFITIFLISGTRIILISFQPASVFFFFIFSTHTLVAFSFLFYKQTVVSAYFNKREEKKTCQMRRESRSSCNKNIF